MERERESERERERVSNECCVERTRTRCGAM